MKKRNIIIIGLLFLAVALSVAYVNGSDEVKVTINTDGNNVEVETSTFLFFNTAPPAMLLEMQEKATEDLVSPYSNVDSLKADMKNIARKYNYSAQVSIISPYGNDQLPMPAKVSGRSMVPTLQDGQDIIVLKTNKFQVGDLVVAIHPEHGLIVKRVAEIKDNEVYLKSDNREIIQTADGFLVPLDTWLPKESVIGVVKVY